MHIINLLKLLPAELISFIIKYLPYQDLNNYRSINDIWKKEIDLERSKRITIWNFQVGNIVQDNDTIKEFYSKLKECNMSIGYSEELLKQLFLYGLSPENVIKVLMDGLQALTLNEMVERLSLEQ
jgi:hypothetical protein